MGACFLSGSGGKQLEFPTNFQITGGNYQKYIAEYDGVFYYEYMITSSCTISNPSGENIKCDIWGLGGGGGGGKGANDNVVSGGGGGGSGYVLFNNGAILYPYGSWAVTIGSGGRAGSSGGWTEIYDEEDDPVAENSGGSAGKAATAGGAGGNGGCNGGNGATSTGGASASGVSTSANRQKFASASSPSFSGGSGNTISVDYAGGGGGAGYGNGGNGISQTVYNGGSMTYQDTPPNGYGAGGGGGSGTGSPLRGYVEGQSGTQGVVFIRIKV